VNETEEGEGGGPSGKGILTKGKSNLKEGGTPVLVQGEMIRKG